jgi:hypothetical protein
MMGSEREAHMLGCCDAAGPVEYGPGALSDAATAYCRSDFLRLGISSCPAE